MDLDTTSFDGRPIAYRPLRVRLPSLVMLKHSSAKKPKPRIMARDKLTPFTQVKSRQTNKTNKAIKNHNAAPAYQMPIKQTTGAGAHTRASRHSNKATLVAARTAGRIKKKRARSRRVQNQTLGCISIAPSEGRNKLNQICSLMTRASVCSLDFFFLTVAPRDMV